MVSLAAFALVGCEGGGPQEGLPKEGERTVSPEMQNQMKINMTPTKPSEIAKKKSEADKTTKAAEAK
jgi:hypothetical protein